MSEKKIINIGQSPTVSHTAGEKVNAVDGQPFENCWVYYNHKSGNFRSGVWDCTEGSWYHEHPKTEFCHILEGTVKMVKKDGPTYEYHAGDSFIIEKGTPVTWIVEKYAKKLFVTAENLD